MNDEHDHHTIVEPLEPPVPRKQSDSRIRYPPLVWVMLCVAIFCAILLPTIAWVQSRNDVKDSATTIDAQSGQITTLLAQVDELSGQVTTLLADNDSLVRSIDCITREDASLDIEKSKTLGEMGETLRPIADTQSTLLQALIAAFATNDDVELQRLLATVPALLDSTAVQLDALDKQTELVIKASEQRESDVALC